MTSLLEGARRMVGRGTDLESRVQGLEAALDAARGRLDDVLVDPATATVSRVAGRLRLSADHTVVALAGATGSGKSSLFNALAGLDLMTVGVRRPTTSHAGACAWGSAAGAPEVSALLDWLEIPERHRATPASTLDRSGRAGPGRDLDGVVLLDLPDHDSTEVAHHLEVDRLVSLADLLVWVLDPQKYADAAVHRRYLRPLASHAEVLVVVLNQIDTVPEARRAAVVDDVRRLLATAGLDDVPLLVTSARDGTGVEELRRCVSERAAGKKVARQRLTADLRSAAGRLQEVSGTAEPRALPRERVRELGDAFADAAGVPTVVAAVESSTRQRANRATGWPVVAWFSRLKPDPLKRLHLDLGTAGRELTGTARTSVPAPTRVQRARVEAAVRELADDASAGLARPWQHAVRRASVSQLDDLSDRLDQTLARTDLGAARIPWWASTVRLLQWLLVVTALAGGVWLLALAALEYLRLDLGLTDPVTPDVGPVPLPTLMLLGGIATGLLLALVCRVLVGWTARSRARTADRRLRSGLREVADELVVRPVQAELAAYTEVRDGLSRALR